MGKVSIGKKFRGGVKRILTLLSPKLETAVNYRFVTGKWLDWKNPQDINAKINWLKVNRYYNNPVVTDCIDKYRIRGWLESKGLKKICPVLYGVYDKADEIAWDTFPSQFVVKCNHSCGANLIVKDKAKLDYKAAEETLDRWLKEDYWREGEVQYRFIRKKIIVEEYLGDGEDLICYKFFCFNGKPKVLYLGIDEDFYIDYYDMEFRHLPYSLPGHQHYPAACKKPDTFEEMVALAEILSSDFPFVRVDLYDAKGKIYISELTFVPTGGYMKIEPPKVLTEWGAWIDLKQESAG